MRRFVPDSFILSLLMTVVVASFLPAIGETGVWVSFASKAALVLVFFLHGARLPVEAVVASIKRPLLHVAIMTCTYIMFPVICLAFEAAMPWLLPPQLWLGVLFVCCLPSTVQSSIAFTAIARGNVAVAVGAATASNIAGVFITPALVSLLMHREGTAGGSEEAVRIMVQILLPFLVGMLTRRWMGAHRRVVDFVDKGSIVLAVYVAFSQAVEQDIWHLFSPRQLAALVGVNAVILTIVLLMTSRVSRAVGLARADEIAVVFCGSKKSLATGVPMAAILFGAGAGITVLPLMIFHQMQLMVCAVLARRYAQGAEAAGKIATGAPAKEAA